MRPPQSPEPALEVALAPALAVLLMRGTDDRLCAPQGSDDFFRAAGSVDKTIKHYEGLYHEIFNEPERDEVLADLAAWLRERLRARL